MEAKMEKFTNEMYENVWAMPPLPSARFTRLILRKGEPLEIVIDGKVHLIERLYVTKLNTSPSHMRELTYGVYADSTIQDLRALVENLIADTNSDIRAFLRLFDDARIDAKMASDRGYFDILTDVYGDAHKSGTSIDSEDSRFHYNNMHAHLQRHVTIFREYPGVEEILKEVAELNTNPVVVEKVKNWICHKMILLHVYRS
jgi:hypothetical protein